MRDTTGNLRGRRQAQTDDTRRLIVAAASRLFLEHGYGATSITALAAEAGVAVQTVYNSVGNKATLLSAVLDAVVSGPNAPVPVPVFMQQRSAAAEDADAVVRLIADWLVEVNERAAALWQVIYEAAAGHREVADLKRRREQGRLHNYELAAAELRRRNALADHVSDQEAAAAIFSLGHPLVYRSLVVDAGWTPDAYGRWLLESLRRALLAQ